MEKQSKELYLRVFSADICDLFEDLLDEHDITIPSEDREGEEGEARIYGDVYYDLEARVTELLAGLCEEIKAAPDVAINVEDYNGFVDEKLQSENNTVDEPSDKKVLSYTEQAELFIKENPGVAWEISQLIERENHREDIIGKLEEHGLSDIPDEDIENLVDEFERALSKNDGYYEAFWASADYVIDEYCMSREKNADVPTDKIMIAILDDGYYEENGSYPEEFTDILPYTAFVFDIPEEFIKKWYEIDEGAWYWVFNKGELICSGTVDPGDIEIFKEHFGMSFEDNSPNLPENIKITAATLALDTDDIYRDKEAMSDILSDYLSDEYGFCHKGFDYEVHYNEFNEPSEVVVSDIQWDVDESLEETSEVVFEKHILTRLSEKGFDISQIELEIINFIDNEHKDCSWYGGAVAEVKYKDFLFSLEARGDVNCTLFDKNGDELGYVKDRNNAGSFRYEMAHCLENDTELYKAKEDGRLVFENNNWFEIFVRTPAMEWKQVTWLSESEDIEECVFEMIETMDEMIQETDKHKQAGKSADKSLNDIVANATARSAATVPNKTTNTELTKE